MKLTIPFKTPSINHLYSQRGYRKFPTKEAKEIRKDINTLIKHKKIDIESFKDKELNVNVKLYENWYNKNNTIKRADCTNRSKFLDDSVFDSLGLDDKQIFNYTIEKIKSDIEYAGIFIELYDRCENCTFESDGVPACVMDGICPLDVKRSE